MSLLKIELIVDPLDIMLPYFDSDPIVRILFGELTLGSDSSQHYTLLKNSSVDCPFADCYRGQLLTDFISETVPYCFDLCEISVYVF